MFVPNLVLLSQNAQLFHISAPLEGMNAIQPRANRGRAFQGKREEVEPDRGRHVWLLRWRADGGPYHFLGPYTPWSQGREKKDWPTWIQRQNNG